MKLNKKLVVLAAAGALSAATAIPAMALENEFHGSYSISTIFSNFQDGGSGDFKPDAKASKLRTNNYFEQRGRIQYTAKASDDLKLVSHFEIDNRFGVAAQAGDLDTDAVIIEVKHLYLDFNLGKSLNVKTGLQAYTDTLKGLFITADVPAIMTTTKLGAYTLGVGFSRFADDNAAATNPTTRLGEANKDLFIWDNKFAFSKDTKAALSYYFLADYAASPSGGTATLLNTHTADQAILLHTIGLSGETKVGPLALSALAAAQTGHQKQFTATKTSRQFHGWAANAAAKMAVGPGTARTALLFASGDNSDNTSHYKGWVGSSVTSYNEGGMMIITRNTANSPSTTDRSLRREITNIALLSLGYDAQLSNKLFANANLGFGWAPSSKGAPVDKVTGKPNASDYLGTEINLETGYKVYDNLTLKAQLAYLFLGGYYKGSATNSTATTAKTPEDPYTMRLLAQFAF